MFKRHINSLFLLLATLFLVSCSSNPIHPSVGIDQAFNAKGSKEALVAKSLAWAAKKQEGTKSIVKVNYHENGKIIGTGLFTVVNSLELRDAYSFTMQIDIKDNHARMVINNIIQVEGVVGVSPSESIKVINENLAGIANSYEKAITTTPKTAESE